MMTFSKWQDRVFIQTAWSHDFTSTSTSTFIKLIKSWKISHHIYHRYDAEIFQAPWCFSVIQFCDEWISLLRHFQSKLLQFNCNSSDWKRPRRISWLCCCVNILSLGTFDGADKGLSFIVSIRLCLKVSKQIIAPRDSDLNSCALRCLFWSFSTSSDAKE